MAKRKNSFGFSLIEAAIVLGIVGLVIGGIWVAAAAVNENKRQSDFQSDLLMLVEHVRKTYAGQSISEAVPESVLLQATKNSLIAADGTLTTPWGKAGDNLPIGVNVSGDTIGIDIMVPLQACVALAPKLSRLIPTTEFAQTNYGGAIVADSFLVNTQAAAASGCASASGNYVDGWVLLDIFARR